MPSSTRRAPNNILANLPADQLVELTGWLVCDNLTYHAAAEKLAETFGIRVSHECVHQFFKRYCAPQMNKRDDFIRRIVQQKLRERLAMPDAPTPPAKP